MVSLPIFIILLGILMVASNNTRIPTQNDPRAQTFATLTADTQVTFDSPEPLPGVGTYKVTSRHIEIDAKRPSTGEVQRIRMNIREPQGAGTNLPGMVFMHGAGHGGTCDDSFGDIATSMSSAGFVTAVIDKPVWSTNDLTRDYPGSAAVYDQAINVIRDLDQVDAHKVGIYATSESTWISSYLVAMDHDIAFQILLSPMVFSPRHAVAFLAIQNFALAGANDGYQAIVRRILSLDMGMFGLTNIDLHTATPQAYSIPTLVAYGSKDVMTAQVQGFKDILDQAHRAGNWNVSLRSYPVANHVLRLGDEAQNGTPFADDYERDAVSWAVGTSRGLTQTSEPIAGAPLYQSIAVPLGLHSRRAMTIYGILVLGLMAIMMLVATVVGVIALIAHIRNRITHRGPALGFQYRFGGSLLMLTIITMACMLLFVGGLGEVVLAVVHLSWGSAPQEDAGMMYWSWPVVQIVCIGVVWAWSRVFAGMIEVASMRGLLTWPVKRGTIRHIVSGEEPVVATTRLGRVLFWTTTVAMLLVLLSFSFWGLFLF
ncbi:esterase [Bifidobacterium pseudolongum subsp. globosum]|mgnify:FL=1|uniref:Esterase n=2 Tax=Bifidobacterium pseudolongum TaxID=1694 RepID=A0A2N3QRR9_9BIFI|nr:alpha/beta hydrolase [Bifidobacterium pseudolongum]MCH4835599.1 alpha/beta hydrolase [Bifidobacterium pseudolongum]MCH4850206.1 alpha/beta hydrolase [Bifidobacterium pseudolongum]PKU94477.1 esterase [Bifidobacterium pseudolongum subsp. globosum]PKU99750.1 esterase [Bifidobacterium pseudolongum subsp. globosum]PKV04658.1 esterase [Bifidobacterium pseudolongum subsp. globosum]